MQKERDVGISRVQFWMITLGNLSSCFAQKFFTKKPRGALCISTLKINFTNDYFSEVSFYLGSNSDLLLGAFRSFRHFHFYAFKLGDYRLTRCSHIIQFYVLHVLVFSTTFNEREQKVFFNTLNLLHMHFDNQLELSSSLAIVACGAIYGKVWRVKCGGKVSLISSETTESISLPKLRHTHTHALMTISSNFQ